jgi:hypothetical protein
MPPVHSDPSLSNSSTSTDRGLVRGIGLWHATALNMIDMIGVGPFVTIPLMVATMHGPQAMVGWILGSSGPNSVLRFRMRVDRFDTCVRCTVLVSAAGSHSSSSSS